MANIQLLSNAASPLKSLLTATNVWSPFEYSVKSSAPNLSRSRVEVKGSAPSNLDKNRTEVFRVPRFGLWSGLTIKIGIRVNCTVPADANATSVKDFSNWLGLFLMQNVTLATHNKVICTIPAEALLFESTYARDSNTRHTLGYLEGENAAGSLYNVAHGQVPGDFTKLTYFHIPVPFSCFESTSCYWDTSFVESLQISVRTRAVLSASGTTLVDIKVEDTLIGFGGGMSRGLSSTSSATAGQYNTTSSKTDGFNVITWGLDSRATSYDSGSCSFKECVAPTLTVSMAAHKTAARAGVKYR